MFSTGKNRIVNPLEILHIPQNFERRKGPANTLNLYLQILILQISTQNR